MTRTIEAAGIAGLLAVACAESARPPAATAATATHPIHSTHAIHGDTSMQSPSPATVTAPVALAVVDIHVASFDAWKAGFDGHAAARRGAGVVSARVNRSADDPSAVTVCLLGGSAESLQTFLSSADRAEAMRRSGVVGTPRTTMTTPVEDVTVKDRPLAGAFVRHHVADFDAWKRGFDGRAAARAQGGVIGHAVARANDDPNEVIVFLQAESVDSLRRFTGSDDLRNAMTAAGVQGTPRVSFVQSLATGQ